MQRLDAVFNTCYDLDGVICDEEYVVDEREYNIAGILLKPEEEVFAIITGRLEKYRNITETWLKKHEIRYKYLIMKPNHLKGVKNTPKFKAKHYKFYKESGLFIESHTWQAEKIAFYSGKPVFSIENNRVYTGKNGEYIC